MRGVRPSMDWGLSKVGGEGRRAWRVFGARQPCKRSWWSPHRCRERGRMGCQGGEGEESVARQRTKLKDKYMGARCTDTPRAEAELPALEPGCCPAWGLDIQKPATITIVIAFHSPSPLRRPHQPPSDYSLSPSDPPPLPSSLSDLLISFSARTTAALCAAPENA